ncbi:MAG: helix-turn-helix domain-containing protein, partial [Microterricola sp.]
QNGQLDATAQLLGVHRHTVRARIAQIEKLLGRDLGGFQERAELWAALLVCSD